MAKGNADSNKLIKDIMEYARKESEGFYLILRRAGWSNGKIAKQLGVAESGLRRKYKHLKV
jgi:hypothetical protein